MATHSNILAWRIPWTEDLMGYSPRGRKESDMTEATDHSTAQRSILSGEDLGSGTGMLSDSISVKEGKKTQISGEI